MSGYIQTKLSLYLILILISVVVFVQISPAKLRRLSELLSLLFLFSLLLNVSSAVGLKNEKYAYI